MGQAHLGALQPRPLADGGEVLAVEVVQVVDVEAMDRREAGGLDVRHLDHEQAIGLEPPLHEQDVRVRVLGVLQHVPHGDGVEARLKKLMILGEPRQHLDTVLLARVTAVAQVGLDTDAFEAGADMGQKLTGTGTDVGRALRPAR